MIITVGIIIALALTAGSGAGLFFAWTTVFLGMAPGDGLFGLAIVIMAAQTVVSFLGIFAAWLAVLAVAGAAGDLE